MERVQVVVQRVAHRHHAERPVELDDRQVAEASLVHDAQRCRNGSSGWIVCGCDVMTSARRVVCGLRPSASTRNSASRSVKMPTRRVPSTTSSAPMLCCFIVRAASSTVTDLGAVTGACLATMVRSERIGIEVSGATAMPY